MPKFRKKPVVIEAFQWDGMDDAAFVTWSGEVGFTDWQFENGGIIIPTLEGTMRADAGDYVIRGVKGEFYPCKPDIFAATHEPVEEAPTVGNHHVRPVI